MELVAKGDQFRKFRQTLPKESVESRESIVKRNDIVEEIEQTNKTLIKAFEMQIKILETKKNIRNGLDESTKQLIVRLKEYVDELEFENSFDVSNERIANARKMLIATYVDTDEKTHSVPIGPLSPNLLSPNLLSPVDSYLNQKTQTPPPGRHQKSKSLYAVRNGITSYGPV